MKLFHLSLNNIPSRGTHSINIMNMCKAFSLLPEVKVTLIIHTNPVIANQFNLDVWNFYGMKRSFDIIYLPAPGLLSRKVPLAKNIHILAKVFRLFFKVFQSSDEEFVIYSRHIKLVGLIRFIQRLTGNKHFKGFFCELHSLTTAKRSARINSGLIAISQSLKDDLLKGGIVQEKDKVCVAHDGVDLSRFDGVVSADGIRRELGIPEEKIVIAYTGRLIAGKGVDTLIHAFAKLSNQDGLFLLLVGKVYEPIYMQLVSECGLDNVRFIDFIPPVQVAQYQFCADILVLPSSPRLIYARYTSPIKLFEYMAAEKPVVASSLDSICEIIVHERNGMLFTPDDASELANVLQLLVTNPALRTRLGKQAKQDVAKYTWAKRASAVFSFINKMSR